MSDADFGANEQSAAHTGVVDSDGGSDDGTYCDDGADETSAMPPPPVREYGNTGPKGVLNDYADAKERLRQRTEEKKRRLWRMAEHNTFATTTVREDDEEEQQQQREKAAQEVDGEDDELARLRAKRLAELKKAADERKSARGVGGSPFVERLGTYDYRRVVQQEAYADQLVAVLIVEDGALEHHNELVKAYCALAQHVAEEQGRGRDEVRCCAMAASDALDVFDEQALPALLVYQAGQLHHCAMALCGPQELHKAAAQAGLLEEDEDSVPARRTLFAAHGTAPIGFENDTEDEEEDDM